MTDLREQRNKQICDVYFTMRRENKSNPIFTQDYCLDAVFNSEQNKKGWCLSWITLKKIITDKNYGDAKRNKKAAV